MPGETAAAHCKNTAYSALHGGDGGTFPKGRCVHACPAAVSAQVPSGHARVLWDSHMSRSGSVSAREAREAPRETRGKLSTHAGFPRGGHERRGEKLIAALGGHCHCSI